MFVKLSEPSRCLLGQLIGQSTRRPKTEYKNNNPETLDKKATKHLRCGRKVLHSSLKVSDQGSFFVALLKKTAAILHSKVNCEIHKCVYNFVHEPKGLVVLCLRSMQQIDMQIDR